MVPLGMAPTAHDDNTDQQDTTLPAGVFVGLDDPAMPEEIREEVKRLLGSIFGPAAITEGGFPPPGGFAGGEAAHNRASLAALRLEVTAAGAQWAEGIANLATGEVPVVDVLRLADEVIRKIANTALAGLEMGIEIDNAVAEKLEAVGQELRDMKSVIVGLAGQIGLADDIHTALAEAGVDPDDEQAALTFIKGRAEQIAAANKARITARRTGSSAAEAPHDGAH